MLIAQITDLHIRPDDQPLSGRVVTRPYTTAAVEALIRFDPRPDLVVVTGDLTDVGSDQEYALVRAELDRLPVPYAVIPGNHDDREGMRRAFADHAYMPKTGPLNWAIDDYPVRLVGLDSLVPGKGSGLLSDETLAWLDGRLGESDRPTIVAIHHPPFPTGITAMDRIGCLNGAAMAEVIARHSHVQCVIAGHHHRPVHVAWAGTIGVIAPSVAHQVALDLRPDGKLQMAMEPPAFLLHQWSTESGLITHQAYVAENGGPQSF